MFGKYRIIVRKTGHLIKVIRLKASYKYKSPKKLSLSQNKTKQFQGLYHFLKFFYGKK